MSLGLNQVLNEKIYILFILFDFAFCLKSTFSKFSFGKKWLLHSLLCNLPRLLTQNLGCAHNSKQCNNPSI